MMEEDLQNLPQVSQFWNRAWQPYLPYRKETILHIFLHKHNPDDGNITKAQTEVQAALEVQAEISDY